LQKVTEPPVGYKPRELDKGTAWCPYCGKESLFGYDARLNNARCKACGISERDFYVRRFNGLWDDKALDALVAGAVKSGRKWDKSYPWEKNRESTQKEKEPPKEKAARCDLCGRRYTLANTSNRQKYCPDCAAEVRRQKLADYKRKERDKKREQKSRDRYDQGTLFTSF
jgi:transposase-like protein